MATKTKDSVLSELAELGASLAEVAEDEAKKQETLKGILGSIDGLDKDTAKELFKNEKVQRLIELASSELAEASDGGPGTIAPGPFGPKRPWTEADLARLIERGEMKLVHDFEPVETIPIFWNGLRRNFQANEPITCAACFVDVYRQHREALRLGEEHAAWLFRKRNNLRDGSMLSEGGMRARGSGDQGHYVPGGGAISMDDREGAAE